MIDTAYAGEDVPLRIRYEDTNGDAIDPDDTTADPTITIIDSSGAEQVSAGDMTANGTGDFEYVWDTDADGSGTGEYTVEVTADFLSETKIARETIRLA